MQILTKRWAQAALLVVAIVLGSLWVSGAFQTAQESESRADVAASVPAPGPGQNKVLLKDLGMT